MTHTVKFEQLEHNFFHVKNQWILVGKGSKDLDRQLIQITKKAHQKIHWFVDNPEYQTNAFNTTAFRNALVAGDNRTELYIHLPKYAKSEMDDIKVWFDKEALLYITFLREKKGPFFAMQDTHDRSINIYYNNEAHLIETKIWLGCSWDNITGLNDYVVPRSEITPLTESKEMQVAKFKARTPMCILKSFKDEEDIWKYLQAEEQANLSPKRITIRVGDRNAAAGAMDIITGTIADALHVPMTALKVDEKNKNGRVYYLDPDAIKQFNEGKGETDE